MKKAQNLIEVALLMCVIAAVSVYLMSVFNDQKTKLTNMSKVTLKTETSTTSP